MLGESFDKNVNMNVNYNYPTTMYESIFAQMYVFLVLLTIFAFYHEHLLSQNCKKIFFYQKYVHLGENTLIHCSQRTLVHIHVNLFYQNSPSMPQ